MKVRLIQPAYGTKPDELEKMFAAEVELMRGCNEPLDIIVMPESCDVPAAQSGRDAYRAAVKKYNAAVMAEAVAMAKRCRSLVFVNCACVEDGKYRNTTYALDRSGNVVGKYFKAHPAPSELRSAEEGGTEMDSSYTHDDVQPYTVEIEGIKFGFMTCYDFYMYESFPKLARQNVDVIIGCSHQRSDTHEALEIINRFLSYNTNAYLVRSSVSLGEDSPLGGCSCVIAPDGTVLADMKSKTGYATVEIDPHKKYYKPAGYLGATKAHYEYIEDGRRPWLYRNCGSAIVDTDADMPYPRLCAHRGFSTVAPENSLPAYGAAVALGADEIEFDLWSTADGVIVSCHDQKLDRVSNGSGLITEKTFAELRQLDFGVKSGEKFAGLRIPTFEDILKKFAGHTIMNIHVKIWDIAMPNTYEDEIVRLIRKYDCEKYCYFMTGNDEQLKHMHEKCPDIGACLGVGPKPWEVVDRAIAIGVDKVQLFKPYFDQAMIDKAHAHGIKCNVFWSDDPEEAKKFLDMGIDCILSNDYLTVKNATESKIAARRGK